MATPEAIERSSDKLISSSGGGPMVIGDSGIHFNLGSGTAWIFFLPIQRFSGTGRKS